jgi:hypothetical protein
MIDTIVDNKDQDTQDREHGRPQHDRAAGHTNRGLIIKAWAGHLGPAAHELRSRCQASVLFAPMSN